jgi:proteic killer suppression protein
MEILFADKKLKRICADTRSMDRKLGAQRAKLLRRRLTEFAAAEALDDLRMLPGPRVHELKADRSGQLSVDLDHPYRLLFRPAHNPVPRKADGGLDWSAVTAIEVLGIEDTH